ncbi:6-chlorohydroxyquinol-1,2-dioxygenase [Sphaerisporangium rufum]|uniref:6-chlorohydroxyquinol-1,2-dioxygenase n=1 Tax=Sphaerisporangium rufum TaxID=1381558 RepID=A0A919R3X2_9ACTN|nr:dioxygenase [Sphaerisporangium rufum]GII76582.1 6-chlorohydroxyquinol-1,2-dioxygenase [Sphaerisporangium rufum]
MTGTGEQAGTGADDGALSRRVLGQVAGPDPRTNEIVAALVRHLHAFVAEIRPTEREWAAGLDFLVRTGRLCTAERDEFILLSDMLGLTTAVDDVNHAGPAGMTPSSVEGPFHSPAPPRAPGDWISAGPERERGVATVVHGRVLDCDGTPLPGATVDLWQADDAGRYDTQDREQPAGNLRGLFTTDAAGRYWFRTVRPASYPVPTDGTAGELLRAIGRHPMRPAHLHYRVTAAGYRPLTTHVFLAGDPYLDSDAAYAVKDELVRAPVPRPKGDERWGMPGPHEEIEFDVRLVPLGWTPDGEGRPRPGAGR